jgi:hypothetical protein
MAYKGKVWDGTAWQDLANSVTDPVLLTEEIINEIIDPYFLMGA